MTKNLWPGYRSWVNDYISYEKITNRELEQFSFTEPVNPAQKIIALLKRYVPGKTDKAVVSRIEDEDPVLIAYAFYSYDLETRETKDPFASKISDLQNSIYNILILPATSKVSAEVKRQI